MSMGESRNEIGDVVDAVEGLTDMLGSVLNLLAARLPTREERQAEEERRAWDMYFAHRRQHRDRTTAVLEANEMLEERRKRFGAGREAMGRPCLLAVTEDLLERTIEALVSDSGPQERSVLAQQLRALVSE